MCAHVCVPITINMMLTLIPLFFQLLTIFVSAKLAAYVKFYQNNKDFIDSLGKFLCSGILILRIFLVQTPRTYREIRRDGMN